MRKVLPVQLLNLPEWTVLATDQNVHDYRLTAAYAPQPPPCPHCHAAPPFQRFGVKEQIFMDLPAHGKRVGINVRRQRYRCKVCRHTFFQPLPDMVDDRFMTKRLLAYIQRESLRDTFVRIADMVGVSEGTIRNIFRDYIATLEAAHVFVTPRWLGIDEIHLLGQPRGILTNVEQHTMYDLLPNRSKPVVTARLLRMPERQQIDLVAIDMWTPYRDAVRNALPHATIVIDKFHVLRLANSAVETVRKQLRDTLRPGERRQLMRNRALLLKRRVALDAADHMLLGLWTQNVPQLGVAYDLKEAFFDIYDLSNRRQATTAVAGWLAALPPDPVIVQAFHPLTTALANWQPEILAYFDHRITNSYTESLNSVVRATNRAGRGYSFEALRAKMLFSQGLHRQYRPLFERQMVREHPDRSTQFEQMPYLYQPFQHESADPHTSYGVALSTLAALLEQGAL